ncbi:hypothetical protein PIB30_096273 [Stylosanthes scabra]|uniref:F-box domain-containing protein n=1 Tax=Stylosanthes scabra TaxID=79078 RepID=A0ABU6XWP8_9FABA|nr:hypothetical protein [Stylosanthes scabra]
MAKPRDYDETKRKPLSVTRNGIKRLLTSEVTPPQSLLVLPDELIAEILLRVPARNLVRLRSVCRSWRTLISSSQFANEHNPCTGLASPSLEIQGFNPVCGFGYDHVNDKIYTFSPKPSWRTIQDLPGNSIVGHRRGVFVPGTATLNWIRSHDTTLDCFVLSLDLVKESFSEFSLPHKDLDNETILQELCVLRNCLAVCFKHRENGWSVWVMQEYGVTQSWTKFAVIPYHPRLSGDYLRPLCVWGNDVLVVVASSSKMVLYNLDDRSFEFPVIDSSILNPTFDMVVESSFHIYHESLVLPSDRVLRSSSSEMRLIKP